MASERDIDDIMKRWHGRSASAGETVLRLEQAAHETLRQRDAAFESADRADAERDAERKRSRRLIEALRGLADKWGELGMGAVGIAFGECAAEIELVLAEYEGDQTERSGTSRARLAQAFRGVSDLLQAEHARSRRLIDHIYVAIHDNGHSEGCGDWAKCDCWKSEIKSALSEYEECRAAEGHPDKRRKCESYEEEPNNDD